MNWEWYQIDRFKVWRFAEIVEALGVGRRSFTTFAGAAQAFFYFFAALTLARGAW
jgi:hypothetical protein